MAIGTINFEQLASSVRDGISVKRVFGDAYEKDGVTVIPVAQVGGGAGGGGGGTADEGGSGGAFGLGAKPVGVYVIRGGEVSWRPAVDVNKIISSVSTAFIVLLLIVRGGLKRRAKRKH